MEPLNWIKLECDFYNPEEAKRKAALSEEGQEILSEISKIRNKHYLTLKKLKEPIK